MAFLARIVFACIKHHGKRTYIFPILHEQPLRCSFKVMLVKHCVYCSRIHQKINFLFNVVGVLFTLVIKIQKYNSPLLSTVTK